MTEKGDYSRYNTKECLGLYKEKIKDMPKGNILMAKEYFKNSEKRDIWVVYGAEERDTLAKNGFNHFTHPANH